MCDMTGFDVVYDGDSFDIVSHFCRFVYCGGGMSLEDARVEIAEELEYRAKGLLEEAQQYREGTHPDLEYFGVEDD